MLTRHKIFFKISTLMIIISVVPISALAILLNKVSENSIRESVSSEFQNIAKRASQEIRVFISGTENVLKLSAEIVGDIHFDEWDLSIMLGNLGQSLEGIESIDLTNKEGKVIAGTNAEVNVEEEQTNYAQEDFFKAAITGKTFYSDVYVPDTLIPTMKIAVPVRQLNEVIGVLVAEITVRYLWDLVDTIKIGKTGHALIVDKQGVVIAHPQRERILKHEDFQNLGVVGSLLKGVDATGEYVNENGVAVLGSGSVVQGLGWGIVVEQSIEEAFSLIPKIHTITIILVVLAIVFAITVGFYRAAQIILPIRQLTEGVRKVAQGDLSYSINVTSVDEIGELAENFNKMTVSLKDAREQLIQSEQLAILGKLSSKIAHEVRNPLEAIKGAAVYLKGKFGEEKIQQFAEIIIHEVNQLNSFVSEVLYSSKKVEVRLVMGNINSVFEELHQLVLRDERFKKIKITKKIDPMVPNSFLDPIHTRMAFLNVIMNAMQSMPNGGEIMIATNIINKLEIEENNYLGLDPDTDYIEITIRDSGKGIPEEIKKDIFKPFVTGKNTGSGLGLSYFYETIKQHHGKVRVHSKLRIGTTFLVYLPVKQVSNS